MEMTKDKVATAYIRVSTNKNSQDESYEEQYVKVRLVADQLGVELDDSNIFCDRSSGKSIKKRDGYKGLCSKIENGEVGLVIVKSDDRLNRNTPNLLAFYGLCYEHNTKIYFYLNNSCYKETAENILLYTVAGAFAQFYSDNLKEKALEAHRYRQATGRSVVFTDNVWGYKHNAEGRLVIDEEEAEMIRLIFDCYVNKNMGLHKICNTLLECGYLNHNGKPFTCGNISDIIHNPKVTGSVYFNTRRYDSKLEKYIRTSKEEWILKDNVIPAIIDKELWNKAQEIHLKAGRPKVNFRSYEEKNKLDISKRVYCGLCGGRYWKCPRQSGNSKVIDLRCSTSLRFGRKNSGKDQTFECNLIDSPENFKGKFAEYVNTSEQQVCGCNNVTLSLNELQEILRDEVLPLVRVDFNKVIEESIASLKQAIKSAGHDDTDERIKERERLEATYKQLEGKIERLNKMCEVGGISWDYYEKRIKELSKEKVQLEKEIGKLSNVNIGTKKQLVDDSDWQDKIDLKDIQEESLVYVIDKILVYPDRLDVFINVERLFGLEGTDPFLIRCKYKKNKMAHTQQGVNASNALILKYLAENPNSSHRKIAEAVGLPLSTIHIRLKQLKDEGKLKPLNKNSRSASCWVVLEEV